MRSLDALQYRTLPEMKECQVPVTAESKERRKMYQVEAERQDLAEDSAMITWRSYATAKSICRSGP